MKKRFLHVFGLLMMVFVINVSAQETSANNLLVNGDFEDGLTGWNGDADNIRVYDWIPYSGDFHFTLKGLDDIEDIGGWQVVEDLTAGATYKLSGFLRNNNSLEDEEIRAGVRNYGGEEIDSSHVYIGNADRVEDEWTPFSIEFTLGETNTSVEVFIEKVRGNNYCYADSFVLELVPENLLVNGDFEDGLTGWNGNADNIRVYDWIPYSGDFHFTLKGLDDIEDIGGWQVVEDLTTGATYKFSGFLRNNNSLEDEEIRAGVRNYGGEEIDSSHVYFGNADRVEDEWTPFSIEFTLGENNTSAEVFVEKVRGNNYCYADAFSLVLVDDNVSTSLMNPKTTEIDALVANGVLNIINAGGGEFSLYNLTGSSILKATLNSNNEVINLSQLPAGVYIVRIVRDAEVFSLKIIN